MVHASSPLAYLPTTHQSSPLIYPNIPSLFNQIGQMAERSKARDSRTYNSSGRLITPSAFTYRKIRGFESPSVQILFFVLFLYLIKFGLIYV